MAEFRINAGKYRHVITFQKLKDTPNSYGETSKSLAGNWEDFVKCRASILPISGKEVIAREEIKGQITHRVFIRYIDGLTSSMRIKFGNRIFEIVQPPINYEERNWEISLLVRENENPPTEAI
jgi:SPP1 family predicted phage head-tail adaptor